jgi:hypothetical protein
MASMGAFCGPPVTQLGGQILGQHLTFLSGNSCGESINSLVESNVDGFYSALLLV